MRVRVSVCNDLWFTKNAQTVSCLFLGAFFEYSFPVLKVLDHICVSVIGRGVVRRIAILWHQKSFALLKSQGVCTLLMTQQDSF